MNSIPAIYVENSYARLPERFFTQQLPSPVPQPVLVHANLRLAEHLGIDPAWLNSPEAVQVFSGNMLLPGSQPIATVYAGHQFGHWNPQLGDGRAILLGEVIGKDNCRYDLQLKGAGQTPYSRMGDGKSPLGPVLREYVISEAMAALGIPTTRSLMAIATGEKVIRERLQPGGILTRVARSHIRVGTFQYFSARNDTEAVKTLADHVVARLYPDLSKAENPYLELLKAVVERQANLIAQWQGVGFIHGVMNTDNMLISGETIDYGPCAFMDEYHPATVFSSIDQQGRYAYQNQPTIAHWNLSWFAQSLLPVLSNDTKKSVEMAQAALDRFPTLFQNAYNETMVKKIGFTKFDPVSEDLVKALLQLMQDHHMDFTLTFRKLSDLAFTSGQQELQDILTLPDVFNEWLQKWHISLQQSDFAPEIIQRNMRAVNPSTIPRNHLVEQAIQVAEQQQDFDIFRQLLASTSRPFDLITEPSRYLLPPTTHEKVTKTFCGT